MTYQFTNWDEESSTPSAAAVGGLAALFQPSAVAIIGATERPGSVGKTVVENLISSRATVDPIKEKFVIYPVNPSRQSCCGLPCFPSITDCPQQVNLAVIITPAKSVAAVLEQCGKAKVQVVIVISAGFKEVGVEGAALEAEMLSIAHRYNIRVIGPNCLGVMAPHWGMNATFAATDALPGSIAFMSQSGAMCTAVLDWSLREKVAFSAFVSIGSMSDIGWGDLIDYLGNDPNTKSILVYMETIGDARHFLSAARSVSMKKPIIVIKAGQTEAAAHAAASHTGSLAGSHDAFLAAMRRAGVLVVDSIGELFNCALVLGKQPRPLGGNLLIITNAGGPGVLATDATALFGANVCKLEPATIAALNEFLPAAWSHANPVDVLGDASAETYAKTMKIALADPNADGALVILSPQSVTDSTGTAKKVIEAFESLKASGTLNKPILCSWMGGTEVSEGFALLNSHGIPTFPHPDAAAKTFGKIWTHAQDLQFMFEVPAASVDGICNKELRDLSIQTLKDAQNAGRELLTEAESKLVLKSFGIPVAETAICATCDEAVAVATKMGFPCVVKLHSEAITHKSDVGGVKLNIDSGDAVKQAWDSIKCNVDKIDPAKFQGVTIQPMIKFEGGIELILGSILDNQFGPLVLFGSGGCMVEIFKDSALSIPPLNTNLAQRQMEATNIYKALKGGHGQRFPGVDVKQVNQILCGFSQMVCDLHEFLAECDVNPLLVSRERMIALDARIVIRPKSVQAPALAIRPYPNDYCTQISCHGHQFNIRPALPNDIHRLIEFHRRVVVKSSSIVPVAVDETQLHQRIVSAACADYSRHMVLVAIDSRSKDIAAVTRVVRSGRDPRTAILHAASLDDLNLPDLYKIIVQHSLAIAKQEGVGEIVVQVEDGFTACLEALGFSFSGSGISLGSIKLL